MYTLLLQSYDASKLMTDRWTQFLLIAAVFMALAAWKLLSRKD